ncbi:MAG: hypothetical protein AB1591_08940 [Pseudomonadota bacterium]
MKSAAAVLMLLSLPAFAGWQFSPAVEVGAAEGKNVFHHLESANRKGLASSAGRIALAWEDDRSGEPRCWLAVREKNAENFSAPQALGKGECYEPVVQGVGDGRFVAAWEEAGAVWAGLAGKDTALRLSQAEAGQVTLAKAGGRTLYAAWAEQAGKFRRIMLARLALAADGLKLEYSVPVENAAPTDDQAYPALAVNADGSLLVAWEDRRNKHTMMLAAHSPDGKLFARPYRLIDMPQVRTVNLGAGMGSMRPTVASCGANCVVAVWLDKRDFLSGYDVYAAFSLNGGGAFTRNLKVQDSFGDNIAQWHASIAASRSGRVVAVWDDERDGSADVWLSDWNGSEFSDDLAVPGASGPGVQSEPVIHLDADDTLHLAWLERTGTGGTRLRYARAVWKE